MNEMNYLAHHGVKGQKWGVRKYQNEDGTLTEEGKRRYNYETAYTQSATGSYKNRKELRAERRAVRKQWRADSTTGSGVSHEEANRKRREGMAKANANYMEKEEKNAFNYRENLRNAKTSDVLASTGKSIARSVVFGTLARKTLQTIDSSDSASTKIGKAAVASILGFAAGTELGVAGGKIAARAISRSKVVRKYDAKLKKRKGY